MRWLRTLTDILWPRGMKCLCCDELSEGALLCPACSQALEGMLLPPHKGYFGTVRSVYRYDGVAKQLVLLLKLNCTADAAEVLAQEMAKAVRDMALPPDTVLTWVTMPKRRFDQRGIDHGRLLCQAVARQMNLPARQLLIRKGRIHTQRGLNRALRLKNLTGTFLCTGPIDVPVLLVDDVLTTGATVSACAEALTSAGAPKVYAITATKAMFHSND